MTDGPYDTIHKTGAGSGVPIARLGGNAGSPVLGYVYNDGNGSTAYDREWGMFLSELWTEERWRDAGFLRIHRSLLVALDHVEQVRSEDGRCSVLVGGTELQVSRRLTHTLREQLRRSRQADR